MVDSVKLKLQICFPSPSYSANELFTPTERGEYLEVGVASPKYLTAFTTMVVMVFVKLVQVVIKYIIVNKQPEYYQISKNYTP